MGSSLASGMLIQYLTTCITCLVLAFTRSYALTLVILSAVPALVIIQSLSQSFANPLAAAERHQTAIAATLVERAIAAISTVKAFNAAKDEQESLGGVLDKTASAASKVNAVWGITSALSQFSSMAMFVQGFWFGAKLVRDGKVSPGDVMAVFWACLIATSNLQMCIPQFITLAKGKFAMVALMTLVEPPAPSLPPTGPESSETAVDSAAARTSISTFASSCAKTPYTAPLPPMPPSPRPIHPIRCSGELSLNNVYFAYPSRPTVPILNDVSVFLPAMETTFIVGGSGSGKSTIAQLLSKLYAPQAGSVLLDGADIEFIEEDWIRRHVAVVAQGCVLFEGTIHDNVAMGVAGCGAESGRTPESVTREEVVDVCTAALMHEFVRELPDGYETKLGNAGMSLSGGQRQRLAIARALLRDPTVLILGKCRFITTTDLHLILAFQTKQLPLLTRQRASSYSKPSRFAAAPRLPSSSRTTFHKSPPPTSSTCSAVALSSSKGIARTSSSRRAHSPRWSLSRVTQAVSFRAMTAKSGQLMRIRKRSIGSSRGTRRREERRRRRCTGDTVAQGTC
jgi:ATP-binding cassette subfamily B (MDR/TAP) protein 1